METDVLIIGAGPAGSAAARALAQSGARVALVDRHDFPRDKACGDALIPDALAALDRLGLKERVLRQSVGLGTVRVYAPNRSHVSLQGTSACLPRSLLDDVLRQAAVEAGAQFVPRHVLAAPLRRDGATVGAAFTAMRTGKTLAVRAPMTLLATGAAARPLMQFGVCERARPSAIGARLRLGVDPGLARELDYLCIVYDEAILPGYGWIFPGPEAVFNVGVGYFCDAKRSPPVANLRDLLTRFLETFPPAAALARHSRVIAPLQGAPLRTALTGAALHRPGLLVIGEAAGSTYSLSGEGIGKAMETALTAAELVSEALAGRAELAEVGPRYASALAGRFGERFRAYKRAQDWLARPKLANFLAGKANADARVRRALEGLFNETTDPRRLFSPWVMMRALLT
jgi:geranylgeranyl reductase family protein